MIAKQRGWLIERARSNFGIILSLELPYGRLRRSPGKGDGTFFITHNEGFFSCLTTFLWSVMDLYRLGQRCYIIDNSMGMKGFKTNDNLSSWYEVFERRDAPEIHALMSQPPLTETDPVAGSKCRRGVGKWPAYLLFDHHGEYLEEIHNVIGLQWLKAFVQAYLQPSKEVQQLCDYFVDTYRISSTPTLAVCYRGTDKYKEITPTPLEKYFEAVDTAITSDSSLEVLIQTDQAQVRDAFVSRYGERAKFITEMPVSAGTEVIHKDSSLCGDRSLFAKKLYAMCLAISKCKTVMTHTGNVGFFLAVHTIFAGNQLVQFR